MSTALSVWPLLSARRCSELFGRLPETGPAPSVEHATRIARAYAVLHDADSRERYDRTGEEPPRAFAPPPPHAPPPSSSSAAPGELHFPMPTPPIPPATGAAPIEEEVFAPHPDDQAFAADPLMLHAMRAARAYAARNPMPPMPPLPPDMPPIQLPPSWTAYGADERARDVPERVPERDREL
jgi:hypothetical protein